MRPKTSLKTGFWPCMPRLCLRSNAPPCPFDTIIHNMTAGANRSQFFPCFLRCLRDDTPDQDAVPPGWRVPPPIPLHHPPTPPPSLGYRYGRREATPRQTRVRVSARRYVRPLVKTCPCRRGSRAQGMYNLVRHTTWQRLLSLDKHGMLPRRRTERARTEWRSSSARACTDGEMIMRICIYRVRIYMYTESSLPNFFWWSWQAVRILYYAMHYYTLRQSMNHKDLHLRMFSLPHVEARFVFRNMDVELYVLTTYMI